MGGPLSAPSFIYTLNIPHQVELRKDNSKIYSCKVPVRSTLTRGIIYFKIVIYMAGTSGGIL